MRNLRWLGGLAVVLAILVGWLVPAALAQESDIDPQQLVLSLDDLPPGFTIIGGSEAYLSNEDAAAGDSDRLDLFNNLHRQIGYRVQFRLADPGMADLYSVQWLDSYVSVFENADDAHYLFMTVEDDVPEGWTRISAPKLGEDNQALTMQSTDENGLEITYRYIAFRKGRAIGSITTAALRSVSLDDSIRLAEKAAAKL